jgi:hypothetical protein
MAKSSSPGRNSPCRRGSATKSSIWRRSISSASHRNNPRQEQKKGAHENGYAAADRAVTLARSPSRMDLLNRQGLNKGTAASLLPALIDLRKVAVQIAIAVGLEA